MAEMQQRCPQCGRQLTLNETGRIGRCPHHQQWYPVVAGAAAEAGQKNADEARQKEALAREKAEEKRQAEEQEIRRRRASAKRKLLLLVGVVLVAAIAVFVLVIRPGMSYDAANAQLTEGRYAEARDGFAALGDYKDAPQCVVLCDAMLDLESGSVADAVARLDELIAQGSDSALSLLRNAFLPIMENWQSEGVPAEAMLQLLARREAIDVDGALGYDRLNYEVHLALAGDVRSGMTADVDGDGTVELITLGNDFSLHAYAMQPDGNARLTLEADDSAGYFVAFGDTLMEGSVDDALTCYLAAHELNQDQAAAAKAALAYRTRATQSEANGDVAAALTDARAAVAISNAAEDFSFYYDMMLRACTDEKDRQTGMDRWDAFIVDEGAMFQRFEAKAKADLDAGALRLQYAAALAAEQDARCVALIEEAYALGADVDAVLTEAIAQQTPGPLLAELRLSAIEMTGAEEHRSLLAEETAKALNGWNEMGLTGLETLKLIKLADENGVALDGVDRENVFRAAAIDAAGAESAVQNVFVSWDGDAYEELLSAGADGTVACWALTDEWKIVTQASTGLTEPNILVYECDRPLVLATAQAKDGFAVLGYDGALTELFREENIVEYVLSGNVLTFGRELPGSIARREQFSYTVDAANARPARTGIEWQENQYPYPADAEATVLRWLEATAYAIEPEQALMVGAEETAGFQLAALAQLKKPDDAAAIAVESYEIQENLTRVEAVYAAEGEVVRAYFAVVNENGQWKLAGAAEALEFAANETEVNRNLPLLTLNEAMNGQLTDKKDVDYYRVLLSQTSEVSLLWQAGTEDKSRVAFVVSLFSADELTKPVISYELTLSGKKQVSNPLFLAPGAYYVSVAPKSFTEVPYSLMLQAAHNPYVETEANDTLAQANPIELNQAYSGSLDNAKDVDCFAVTLTEPGRLTVKMAADSEDQRSARYTVAVGEGGTGKLLTAFQMNGNVTEARSSSLYLGAGSYCIQITKGKYTSSAAYEMTAEFAPMSAIEQELNGTIETATAINVNETVTGSFGAEKDEDWFTFTLATDCIVQPRLSFTALESSTKTYVLAVMDGANPLLTVNIGGKENQKVIVPLALPAGTYAIRLTNPAFTAQDYQLFVTAVETAHAEHEPNDALGQATELALAAPVSGVLTHDEDIDLYKVALAEESEVTLSFKFNPGAVEGTTYVVQIEQNGKRLWSANVKGSSGGFEQPLKISAGEYFIRIKASEWVGEVYTLELK